TVRGNATIIDHGQGVYSGLYHQAEIYVSAGDHVTAGQLIGKIGDTGRVTGPHVHWDLWVNGIQVNPTQWLNETFPH
ncbi:MAG TPA: M23 family metallopeptidase, partial [Anaerolineales bacterium]